MMDLRQIKQFKSGVRYVALSGVLAVVTTGGWLIYSQTFNQAAQPLAVRLLTVKRGNVELVINESGTVELGGQQQLKSPGEVTVDRVLVKVGDRVRFGQKLIILRNPQRQTNLENQQLEIRKQELKLPAAARRWKRLKKSWQQQERNSKSQSTNNF
jgi:HlyD family secretion protein